MQFKSKVIVEKLAYGANDILQHLRSINNKEFQNNTVLSFKSIEGVDTTSLLLSLVSFAAVT